MMAFLNGIRLGQIHPIPKGKKRRSLPLLSKEKLVTKNKSAQKKRWHSLLGIKMKLIFPLKVQMAEPTGDRKLSIHFHCTEDIIENLNTRYFLKIWFLNFLIKSKWKFKSISFWGYTIVSIHLANIFILVFVIFEVLPLRVKVKEGSINYDWSLVKPPRFTSLNKTLIPEEVFFSPSFQSR